MPRFPRALAVSLAALAPLACATAVETPVGAGGAGGTGGANTGGATSSSSGTGGQMGPCVMATDCDFLDDVCNEGICINGACQKQAKNDGAACDDGLYCTEGDICSNGACIGGSQKFCPSTDNCHIGTCVEATKSCGSAPGNDGAQCDDLDPCTGQGVCFNGTCSKGTPVDCSIFDGPCSVGTCDPQFGCKPAPKNDGASCDDGLNSPCTQGQCFGGACTSVPFNEGGPCNDNLFCTVNDYCQSGKCVAGGPNTCAAPGDVCLIGSCDEAQDTCTAVPGNNGGACNDSNACTTGETCESGTCGGGQPTNNGGACDDKNACTKNDTCANGTCAGTAIVQCQNGDGCCAPGCDVNNDDDCKLIDVGIVNGDFYTDDLRAHLASQPFIQKAEVIPGCTVADFQKYDVVVVYGNMSCFDNNAFNTYVQGGGGLIGTPWIYNNNGGLDCLPVQGQNVNTQFNVPLNVTVTTPNDPLLQGVQFVNGDPVGYEEWDFTLKPGATSSVLWNNNPTHHAVAKWAYGQGRAVYLDFHYITSDCTLAIKYPWGKKLAYNAVLWAAKAIN